MKRCTDCFSQLRNLAKKCDNCGESCEPRPDRARLLSSVVDFVLKDITERGLSASDEEVLVTVEVLLALNQSPVYKEWLKQIAKTSFSNAFSSAILFGWALREEVESNWWEPLPRVSNETYTEFLRQAARDIGKR